MSFANGLSINGSIMHLKYGMFVLLTLENLLQTKSNTYLFFIKLKIMLRTYLERTAFCILVNNK